MLKKGDKCYWVDFEPVLRIFVVVGCFEVTSRKDKKIYFGNIQAQSNKCFHGIKEAHEYVLKKNRELLLNYVNVVADYSRKIKEFNK